MGWRRAFCTGPPNSTDRGDDNSDPTIFKSIDPDPTPTLTSSRSPRFGGRLNFFTSSSNPSTPRLLRCRTSETDSTTPKIHKPLNMKSGESSPLKLSLFRSSFRSRNGCGVCGQSVKSGRGTAVYTAQCGHVFHYPCIATHVRGTSGMKLTCLVCNVEWSDEPLLAVHQHLSQSPSTKSQQTDNNRNRVDNNSEVKQVISTTKPPPQSPSSSAKTAQFQHCHSRPVQIKCYDDDEPLCSPWTVKLEDDTEERHTTIQSRCGVEIRLMPESALISMNSDHQTCAMVLKLKAPQLPETRRRSRYRNTPLLDASRRAPIDLVTVLDVSGSMMGKKMQMMRRAMRLVISSLGPEDRLSIVAFSSVPKRLFPLRRMTQSGQRSAGCIVDRLESSQGSCVTDALMKASMVLEGRRERNPVATIILLSDGQVDSSESESHRPVPYPLPPQHSATRFAHVEIPVNSPADDTFAKWVGGLLSVVVQDLRIELEFAHSSSPLSEITAVYCSDRQLSLLNSSIVSLGDLYAEEKRELLVELQVPIASIRTEKFLTLKCSYNDPATHQRINTNSQTFTVPQACSNHGIHRLRNVFISTRAVAESRRIILEHGEFASAHRLLSSARALLIQSGSSMSADECVKVLELEIMEVTRLRQEQQMQEQERMVSLVRRQGTEFSASTPSSAGKKMSWSRVTDLHGFENARF